MSDEEIALANHADADDMADFAMAHADELNARDRAAAQARHTTEATCKPDGS